MLISEDSRLAPLSGSMTKWDYMVVILSNFDRTYAKAKTSAGEELSVEKWVLPNRHVGLKELGEKGWELIKIRGGNENSEFYFKKPL